MAVDYVRVSEDFIRDLREKYGSISGIEVVPYDFPSGLDKLLLNTHIILKHCPDDSLAKARMNVVRDYLDEQRRLTIVSQLSLYAPSH